MNVKRGVLLIEALIAIAIIGSSITFILGAAALVLRLTTVNLQTVQASYLLAEGAEVARFLRDNDWASFRVYEEGVSYALATSTGGWWLTSTSSELVLGGGTRMVTFAPVYRDALDAISISGVLDVGTRHVVVAVELPLGATSSRHTVRTYLSNIHE